MRPERHTVDCDVIRTADDTWDVVAAAATDVAARFDLPPKWLNRDCEIFAWCLPIGWADRSVAIGSFGRLEVHAISRFDLLAAKLIASAKRRQDLLDLHDLRPTATEISQLEDHLDQLSSEHLDGESFRTERRILQTFRGQS
jgi:hypothetical protein